ncbi:MAG: hypothetical protein HQL45_16225 [Alphaproteobacteria bacterium]|nr:hypothetical protein [Alphaproteobacteria bacterium]
MADNEAQALDAWQLDPASADRSPYKPVSLPDLGGPVGCDLLLVSAASWAAEVASELRRLGGHRVILAVTGAQALESCARDAFQLIVLDEEVEDVPALDLAWQIRKIPGQVQPVSLILLVKELPAPDLTHAYGRVDIRILLSGPPRAERLQRSFRLLAGEILAWGR